MLFLVTFVVWLCRFWWSHAFFAYLGDLSVLMVVTGRCPLWLVLWLLILVVVDGCDGAMSFVFTLVASLCCSRL